MCIWHCSAVKWFQQRLSVLQFRGIEALGEQLEEEFQPAMAPTKNALTLAPADYVCKHSFGIRDDLCT
jgi:hypothetical protein